MLKDYIQLIRADKPIGTLLLLWPTLWSLFIAAHGLPPIYSIVVFSLGVFLTRSAGCAINDVLDADFDKHVERTKSRPITSGRVSKKQGVIACVILSLTAFLLAYFSLSSKALFWCIPALFIFITYPLMKRFFPLPQAYLGIAFSMGIPMGFVELTGSVSLLAYLCFTANLFWVLGYDTIYALVDKDDDLVIGIKTSAITMGKQVINFIACCYILFVLLQFAVGILIHAGTSYYLALGVASILLSYQIIIIRQNKCYFPMFLLNNWVGISIFLGVIMGVI